MADFRLSNSVLRWFLSYFDKREQYVKVGNSLSDKFIVHSSVGQGTVLGPLLFLMFFNDSDIGIESFSLSFADDKKIFQQIKNEADSKILQDSIDKFVNWCSKNGLSLNLLKCNIMTYSLQRITLHNNYYIDNQIIQRTDEIKDLGVIFDSKLNFTSHVEFITKKASANLAFVKRQCYKTFHKEVAKLLYFALVRSNLEFASSVWLPSQSKQKNMIESVQKNFIKFIHPNNSANNPNNVYQMRPYSIRCDELNIQLLIRRRINASLIFLHDVISGRISSKNLRNRIKIQTGIRTLRNPAFIKINSFRTDNVLNSSFITTCKIFNLIALFIDPTLPKNEFKKEIIKLPDSVFLKYLETG